MPIKNDGELQAESCVVVPPDFFVTLAALVAQGEFHSALDREFESHIEAQRDADAMAVAGLEITVNVWERRA